MKRQITTHPYLAGMISMALVLFVVCLAAQVIASDLWSGGRPITDLGPTDRGLLIKIDEEPHTPEEFCGIADSPSFPTTGASAETMSPFVLTGGNDTWGEWAFLIGSSDIPIRADKEAFDIHEVLISSVSASATGRIQLGWDATTSTVILSNESYTSVMFQPSGVGANVSAGPISIRMPDQDVGTLIFGRCWIDGESGATVDIFLGTHEFDE